MAATVHEALFLLFNKFLRKQKIWVSYISLGKWFKLQSQVHHMTGQGAPDAGALAIIPAVNSLILWPLLSVQSLHGHQKCVPHNSGTLPTNTLI